jgi:ketosteroid isomerase-like protein
MKNKFQNTILTTVLTSLFFSLIFTANAFAQSNKKDKNEKRRQEINALLDEFNVAAANADFNKYFDFFAEDAIFIGTDATENWDKKSFMVWAKPYFDKKRTWNFKSIERHIFFDKTGDVAWFDELLDTQMKICRGSGVLTKQGGKWKIQQYVLSMTIPNDQVDEVVKMKAPIEDELIKRLSPKQP